MLEKCTKFTFRMLLFKVAGSLRSQLYLREIPYILNILSHIYYHWMSFSAKFLFKIFFPPLIFLLGALSLRLGALYVFYIFQILVYCRIFVCVFFCTCFFVFFWLCWVGTSYGTRALRFCARASLSCSM